jgi:hypothetical protein
MRAQSGAARAMLALAPEERITLGFLVYYVLLSVAVEWLIKVDLSGTPPRSRPGSMTLRRRPRAAHAHGRPSELS